MSISVGSEAPIISICETISPTNTNKIGHNISITKPFISLEVRINLREKHALRSLQNLDFFV